MIPPHVMLADSEFTLLRVTAAAGTPSRSAVETLPNGPLTLELLVA
jgi:hypothetical protein